MKETQTKKPGLFARFLNGVEKVGNKLPQPITLFFILAVGIVVLWWADHTHLCTGNGHRCSSRDIFLPVHRKPNLV